jgi:hypothetical protein
LATLACLLLIPNPGMVRWTPLSQEPFFQPQNVISALGRDTNVIMLPYGETGPSMIWQMASGMGFTQSGGYIGFLPPAERAWRILQNFYAGVGGPTFENDISAFCVTHQVSAILVGPGTPAPLAAAVDALHWPETNDHGVRIVHVEIRVDNGSDVSHYRIGQPDTQLLTLPANASVNLTANATFVPARLMRNGDERHLSVAIDLQPM